MTLISFLIMQDELIQVIEERTGKPTDLNTTILALFTEVAEYANQEGSFKTWKLNHKSDREKEVEEFVDIFFFWLQIARIKGYQPGEIKKAYLKKWQKNIDRQRNNY